jgi:hypothetical protein
MHASAGAHLHHSLDLAPANIFLFLELYQNGKEILGYIKDYPECGTEIEGYFKRGVPALLQQVAGVLESCSFRRRLLLRGCILLAGYESLIFT